MQAVGFAAQIHWRRANRFVIPRSEATWESRSTMVNNRNASAKTQPVAGDCHVGLRPPRNDKLGGLAAQNVLQSLPTCKALATRKGHAANGCAGSAAAEAIGAAVLTIARASCWYVAGQGMPCPYNFI